MFAQLFFSFWTKISLFSRKLCPYVLTCTLNRCVRILDSLEYILLNCIRPNDVDISYPLFLRCQVAPKALKGHYPGLERDIRPWANAMKSFITQKLPHYRKISQTIRFHNIFSLIFAVCVLMFLVGKTAIFFVKLVSSTTIWCILTIFFLLTGIWYYPKHYSGTTLGQWSVLLCNYHTGWI